MRLIRPAAMMFALLMSVAWGCDKPGPDSATNTAEQKTDAPTPAVGGKFSVSLKVSASQEVYKVDGAPKPEDVERQLNDAIYATDAFEKGGERPLKGLVNYDIKTLPDNAGFDLVLLGSLNSPGANFDAGVNVQSTDEHYKGKSIEEMVDGAIALFASRIGDQGRVLGGDDENLRKILENQEEAEGVRLMAIQEVRERRLTKYLDVVRPFLSDQHPVGLRLAASATLVSLGDQESRADIVKVAEDFSRDRNPQFVPMLHILGDLGGPEVITYIEAVAEGHSAPAVRTVAKEVLEKAYKSGIKP